jgi:hypothetical protein
MIELTVVEKIRFEEWVVENVTSNIVPSDEANGEALVFNLVHLIRGDGEQYAYTPEQDEEVNKWFPE